MNRDYSGEAERYVALWADRFDEDEFWKFLASHEPSPQLHEAIRLAYRKYQHGGLGVAP